MEGFNLIHLREVMLKEVGKGQKKKVKAEHVIDFIGIKDDEKPREETPEAKAVIDAVSDRDHSIGEEHKKS